ncbi:hypothetical protein D9619_005209 [Psilocybe cf. subviscida]|uniref:BTB domain-containing protein n=1 Tax=Psilocybe cf. subviscida TaxID=2480587 RepID=A0A8H5FC45_9AGAR|nr:hypothetical protein D9619_005209 [Psilocybe cf. subviscida]
MLPPTTKGIERSASMLSSPREPEPVATSPLSSFYHVATEQLASSSRFSPNAEAYSKSAGKAKVHYHPNYYIESAYVVLQVQNTLFRVPSYRFTDGSQFFKGMLGLPQPAGGGDSIEGVSESNPIVIPANSNINAEEFGDFMKALYPRPFSVTLKLSKTEWISVLKVSKIWYFLEIRSVAISQLESGGELTCIDKVVLGRQNWVRSWVVDGLVGIVQRRETITDEEAIQIDYITAVKLFRIRETRIAHEFMTPTGLDVSEEVQAVFSDEIAHIASEEQAFCTPESEVELPGPLAPLETDSVVEPHPNGFPQPSSGWGFPSEHPSIFMETHPGDVPSRIHSTVPGWGPGPETPHDEAFSGFPASPSPAVEYDMPNPSSAKIKKPKRR